MTARITNTPTDDDMELLRIQIATERSFEDVTKTTAMWLPLKQILSHHGLRVIDVAADNNCQFSALAHQLSALGLFKGDSEAMRAHLVDHQRETGEWKNLVGESEDADKYLDDMAKHGGLWGDGITLATAGEDPLPTHSVLRFARSLCSDIQSL